jgi:hypothetical protein
MGSSAAEITAMADYYALKHRMTRHPMETEMIFSLAIEIADAFDAPSLRRYRPPAISNRRTSS